MRQYSALTDDKTARYRTAVLLFTAIILLGWIGLNTQLSTNLLSDYGNFLFLGITGAIFANSTGAGGGVIFIPAFDLVGLTAAQSVSTSFAIQCFGMTAGSLSWLYHYRKHHGNDPHWAPLPTLVLISSTAAVAGIGLAQLTALKPPGALHFIFSWFSIALGLAIIVLAISRKSSTFRAFAATCDLIALTIIGLLGGIITAWLSVGVGELVVIYLLMRKYQPSMAVACGVVVSAITVWSASPATLSPASETVFAIVLFAGPGAIIGGLLAKKLAVMLPVSGLKLFFATWIILTGVITLLRYS